MKRPTPTNGCEDGNDQPPVLHSGQDLRAAKAIRVRVEAVAGHDGGLNGLYEEDKANKTLDLTRVFGEGKVVEDCRFYQPSVSSEKLGPRTNLHDQGSVQTPVEKVSQKLSELWL